MSRKSKSKYKSPVSASQSKWASRVTTSSLASWACAVGLANVQIKAMTRPSSAASPPCALERCSSALVTTSGPLAANGYEAKHVGKGKHEAARAGVHAEAEIAGQIHRKAGPTGVADGRARDLALPRHAIDAHAGKKIDAVDGAMAAKQRDAILTGEFECVLPITHLNDVRTQKIARRSAIEVHT